MCSFIFIAMNSLSVWMIGSLISTIINPEFNQLIEDPTTINDNLKLFTQRLIGQGTKIEQLRTVLEMMSLDI